MFSVKLCYILNMKKIICVADAPGPAEFLLPVVPLLLDDFNVTVVAVEKANNVFNNIRHLDCSNEETAEKIYQKIKPDLLVIAISSLPNGPYVNNKFMELAFSDKIPIIGLQDFWANHRHPHNRKMVSYCAAVCVPDDFSSKLWKEDDFKGKIYVMGNPAFDRLMDINVESERERLNSLFGFKDEDHLILYSGQGVSSCIEEDKKTFRFLTDTIRSLYDSKIKLLVHPHPRAVETSYYKEYSHDIPFIDISVVPFAENILPAVDVCVAMYSTNLIHACLLRISAVSILLPDAGKKTLDKIGLADLPTNTSGATIGVYEEDIENFSGILNKIFNDKKFLEEHKKAQEDHFPLKEKSAKKVADVLRRFL